MFPDGQRVVSGSADNTLKVWFVATGACEATLKGHPHCTYVRQIETDSKDTRRQETVRIPAEVVARRRPRLSFVYKSSL